MTVDTSDFSVETTSEAGVSTIEPAAPPPEATTEAETPTESSEPVEASPESTPEASNEPPYARADDGTFKSKAKKGSLQYRIDQKSWEAGEARRQAQQERAAREQLETRLAEFERAAKPAPETRSDPAPADGKPALDQFATYEDYVEAVAEWKAEQKFTAREATYARQSEAQQQLQRVQQFRERQERFIKSVDDYWPVIDTIKHIQLPPVMDAAVKASEQGPEILYFLGTHREELDRLMRETASVPADAAPLMRRLLESQLAAPASSPAQAAAVVRPSVPVPIKPVGSGPSVAEVSLDDLDTDRYIREANRREGKPVPRTAL